MCSEKKKKLLVNQFIIYTWSTVAREKPRARNAYRSSYNGNIEKFVSSFTIKKKVSAVKPSLATSPTATTRVRERNPLNVHPQAISHLSNSKVSLPALPEKTKSFPAKPSLATINPQLYTAF